MSDELDRNWRDQTAFVTKIAVSSVPIFGGPLGELITLTIPRLRQERIVEYVRQLDDRVRDLEDKLVKLILDDVEKIDLIETGAYLAARATTSDRITRIIEVVFRGLCAEQTNTIRRKRLLGLLAEIDDDELLLLNAYGQSQGPMGPTAWDMIEKPPLAVLGASTDQLEDAKLYELGKQNLLRLGLLKQKFAHLKKGEYPPFDTRSGGFKSRPEISYLGRILLKEVGIDLPYKE